MNVKITPSALNGPIKAVASKSAAHRALICSALSDIPTEIIIKTLSKDITATMDVLRALGSKIIEKEQGIYVVYPLNRNKKEIIILNCKESGSTLRFILPVAAALGGEYRVEGEGRLPERPISPLINELKNGCSFSSGTLPIEFSGKLKSGIFSLPGNISSQFISGLLFALPLLSQDSEIKLTTPIESIGYVNMTTGVLSKFGITVFYKDNLFEIPGSQKYKSPGVFNVEGDWSNSAFFLCAAAIQQTAKSNICCSGLDFLSLQDDRQIIDILKKAGAEVLIQNNSVRITCNKLRGMEIDASNIPDLVPVLGVLLSVADGKSVIKNVGRLRLKESDRLHAISENLNKIGALVKEREDSLEITGKPILSGGIVDGYNDHRIVMAMAIASAVCQNEIVITNAEAVEKSYPEFFTDFKKLGGKVNVI